MSLFLRQNGSGPGSVSATIDLPPDALPAAETQQEPAPDATVDISSADGDNDIDSTGGGGDGDGGNHAESAVEQAAHVAQQAVVEPVEKAVDAIGTKVGFEVAERTLSQHLPVPMARTLMARSGCGG